MSKCILCNNSMDDELLLGKFVHKNGLRLHHFCMLLSSGLAQNGTDTQGIYGFLVKDIQAEVERVSQLKCCYCGKVKANIGCCNRLCRRTFHTYCGLQKGCVYEFDDTFQSFCPKHHNITYDLNSIHSETDNCIICFEPLGKFDAIRSILAPCCKSGWFHKLCLMEFARKAGYFFKCPLCNNTDDFRLMVKLRGVYVPDQDAEWELEENAFGELLERPDTCEAKHCRCPRGRKHTNKTVYSMIYCDTCGAHSMHKQCWTAKRDYICDECIPIVGVAIDTDHLTSECETDTEMQDICLKENLNKIKKQHEAKSTRRKSKWIDAGSSSSNHNSPGKRAQIICRRSTRLLSQTDSDYDKSTISTRKRRLTMPYKSNSVKMRLADLSPTKYGSNSKAKSNATATNGRLGKVRRSTRLFSRSGDQIAVQQFRNAYTTSGYVDGDAHYENPEIKIKKSVQETIASTSKHNRSRTKRRKLSRIETMTSQNLFNSNDILNSDWIIYKTNISMLEIESIIFQPYIPIVRFDDFPNNRINLESQTQSEQQGIDSGLSYPKSIQTDTDVEINLNCTSDFNDDLTTRTNHPKKNVSFADDEYMSPRMSLTEEKTPGRRSIRTSDESLVQVQSVDQNSEMGIKTRRRRSNRLKSRSDTSDLDLTRTTASRRSKRLQSISLSSNSTIFRTNITQNDLCGRTKKVRPKSLNISDSKIVNVTESKVEKINSYPLPPPRCEKIETKIYLNEDSNGSSFIGFEEQDTKFPVPKQLIDECSNSSSDFLCNIWNGDIKEVKTDIQRDELKAESSSNKVSRWVIENGRFKDVDMEIASEQIVADAPKDSIAELKAEKSMIGMTFTDSTKDPLPIHPFFLKCSGGRFTNIDSKKNLGTVSPIMSPRQKTPNKKAVNVKRKSKSPKEKLRRKTQS